MDKDTENVHPLNESLTTYFKDNSVYDSQSRTYRLHARPDLTGELDDIIAETDIPSIEIIRSFIYGYPVRANKKGIIFAWTGGTHDIFLRLSRGRVDAACNDGARIDNTYPPEWINFYIIRLGQNWRDILKRWIKIAYEDAAVLS